MASLTGNKIKDTYSSLIKVSDNGTIDGSAQGLTDGAGNTVGLTLTNAGVVVSTTNGTLIGTSDSNVVTATLLNVSGNGSVGEVLTSDGDGSFSWAAATTGDITGVTAGTGLTGGGTSGTVEVSLTAHTGDVTGTTALTITDNVVGADELNVSGDGSAGQALLSDGDGTMSWGAAGSTYTAGDGITLNTLEFDLDAGLTTVTSIYNTALKVGRDASGDWIDFGTDDQISFHVGNAEEMRLEADGDLHTEGDVIAYSTTVPSDEKLKDNIQTIDNAIDKLKQIKGVTFEYKKNGKTSAGIIAQDLEKVLPEVVKDKTSLDGSQTYKTVDYNGVIAMLIESVKELEARVSNCECNKNK